MKDWEYYTTTKYQYPDKYQFRRDEIDKISKERLTVKERQDKIKEVESLVNAWYKKESAPYLKEIAKLEREFWGDCRIDLGYNKFLSADAMNAIEAYAWEHGHSHGFSEVYCYLVDIVELAKIIVRQAKIKNLQAEVDIWNSIACPVCRNDYDVAKEKDNGSNS